MIKALFDNSEDLDNFYLKIIEKNPTPLK